MTRNIIRLSIYSLSFIHFLKTKILSHVLFSFNPYILRILESSELERTSKITSNFQTKMKKKKLKDLLQVLRFSKKNKVNRFSISVKQIATNLVP